MNRYRTGVGWPFLLGLSLTSACVELGNEDNPPASDGTAVQEIHGPSAPASRFELDRAVKIPGCTATRITANFAITALHCQSSVNDTVRFYSTGPGFDGTLPAKVEQVITRPGTNAVNCHDNLDCNDSTGLFSDVALLRLSTDVVGSVDPLGGPQATLAWRYPGANVAGTSVGAGGHNGMPNPSGVLLQVTDTTDDGNDDDGEFWTTNAYVDPGDSGGPFYVQNRILGTLTGYGWDILAGNYDIYDSVPKHLDWILSKIGYAWAGIAPQPNMVYNGTNLESFVATERVCQYACEKTTSCEAYNYNLVTSSCGLYSGITGTHAQTGWEAALHYGASSGKSADVTGYVRSDGFNSVVHKATDGSLHELFRSGATWAPGTITPSNGPLPAIGGKLSGYRRSDGTNAIVYRSTGSRIIEVSLGATWSWADLTSWGGATPAGDPVAYIRADGVNAVVFRSSNGHINELRLGTKSWIPTDLSATSGVPATASSEPAASIRSDGLSSVVFRSGTNIFELFKAAGQAWDWGEPSTFAAAPAAASRPYGYNHHDGTTAIVYRSTANRLIELWLDGAGWHAGDITSAGQTVAGDPVAYVRSDAIESVVYRSTANQLNELTNNPWQAWNLTAQWGAGAATTDPSLYVRKDGTNAVVFGLAGNHAGELSYHIGALWQFNDLTSAAGEAP